MAKAACDVDQERAEWKITVIAFADEASDPPAQQRPQTTAQTDPHDIQRRHPGYSGSELAFLIIIATAIGSAEATSVSSCTAL
jgi:hypothetical protein